MLKITIPASEDFDESKQEFVYSDEVSLELEHSLLSLSKWESIWEKPFIGDQEKSIEETLSYIRCMILTPDVPPEITNRLTNNIINQVNNYIDAKMSATFFNERPQPGKQKKSKEIITSELIYYWMGLYKIWKECEQWHLNRLFTLIKVHSAKSEAQNTNKRPRSTAEMMAERRKLNEQRKAALNTTG